MDPRGRNRSRSLAQARRNFSTTLPAIEPMNERAHKRGIERAQHTLNDTTMSLFPSLSPSLRPSVSLRGDINCLLPNLIRNFRRRGNLTSFLFSLARSRARCWRGSRSQDFSIHDRSRAGSDQTTGHPRSNLINLYRCVTYALGLCLFLSFSASLRPRSASFHRDERKIESTRERERERESTMANCRRVEERPGPGERERGGEMLECRRRCHTSVLRVIDS